jgi:hypothetical protein
MSRHSRNVNMRLNSTSREVQVTGVIRIASEMNLTDLFIKLFDNITAESSYVNDTVIIKTCTCSIQNGLTCAQPQNTRCVQA